MDVVLQDFFRGSLGAVAPQKHTAWTDKTVGPPTGRIRRTPHKQPRPFMT